MQLTKKFTGMWFIRINGMLMMKKWVFLKQHFVHSIALLSILVLPCLLDSQQEIK